MGFEISLLLVTSNVVKLSDWDQGVRPGQKKKEKSCVLWSVVATLNIGRVSGPVRKEDIDLKTPKERAAIHFVDSIWGDLTGYSSAVGKKCFVPPFTIVPAPDDARYSTGDEWRKQFVAKGKNGAEFVEPLGGMWLHPQVPSQRVMEEHNTSLKKGPPYANEKDLVRRVPLVWFNCADVLSWLNGSSEKECWTRLKKHDDLGWMHIEMWKSGLLAVGRAGGKCIFSFEDASRTSFVTV